MIWIWRKVWGSFGVLSALSVTLVVDQSLSGCSLRAKRDGNFVFRKISDRELYAFIIPMNATPSQINQAAKDFCGSSVHCSVVGWLSAGQIPTSLPLTDGQVNTKSYEYILEDINTLEKNGYFDCRVWRMLPKYDCIPYTSLGHTIVLKPSET